MAKVFCNVHNKLKSLKNSLDGELRRRTRVYISYSKHFLNAKTSKKNLHLIPKNLII